MKTFKIINLIFVFALLAISVSAQYKNPIDTTIESLNKQIQSEPQNAPLYAERGFWHEKKDNLAAAIADYSTAIKLSAKDTVFYRKIILTRANLYLRTRQFDLAHADATEYVAAREALPDNNGSKAAMYFPYILRGKTYAALNKADLALADFNKAASVIENNASVTASAEEKFDLYYFRARINLSQSKYDSAAGDFTKAIEVLQNNENFEVQQNNRNLALLYSLRAETYCKMGKKSQAKSDEKKTAEFGGKIITPCN
jgi:tetratricopeptide (TPR) repeat protein